MLKFDLHIHTKYTKDSLMDPERIIKIAQKMGLSGVAITDHNAMTDIRQSPFIIPGSEIKTEYGDIIGLFIKNEIKSRNFLAVQKEIKEQGGLVALAHPYNKGGIRFPEELIPECIDLIEVFNSRMKKEWNEKAFELAQKYQKPVTCGSDAHSYFEIGRSFLFLEEPINTINDLKAKLLARGNPYSGKLTPYYISHGLSFICEKIKKYL